MKATLKILAAGAIIGFTMTMTACGGDSKSTQQAKSVEQLLSSDGSGSWTRIKDNSRIGGYAVFLGPDGRYYAFKTSLYSSGMTRDQFVQAATVYSGLSKSTDRYEQYGLQNTYYYTNQSSCPYSYGGDTTYSCTARTDAYGYVTGYDVTEYDYGYQTISEDIFTDGSSHLVFELGDTTSKDLEAVAAKIETTSNSAAAASLVSNFGLSENRAAEVASLANSWKNISKTRTMTSKDLVEFQVKVFGADLNAISKASKKAADGDTRDYNTLISKAAAMNDMSPEQAKAILESFTN
jgi:hypothetical protein